MNSLSRDVLWGHMVPGSALREPLPSWGLERKPKWPVRGDHVEQIPGPDFGPGQGGLGLSSLRGLRTLTAAQRALASSSRPGLAEPSMFLEDPECLQICTCLSRRGTPGC